jgi:hypothetical protein
MRPTSRCCLKVIQIYAIKYKIVLVNTRGSWKQTKRIPPAIEN